MSAGEPIDRRVLSAMDLSVDTCVDVAIVGGGLVGRPLAAAFVDAGFGVALIERESADPALSALAPLDQRCTAIAATSIDWLNRAGLWDAEGAAAEPIRRVHVSHRGHFGATRIGAQELGRELLGCTVENRHFLTWLATSLDALPSERLLRLRGVELVALEPSSGQVTLVLGDTAARSASNSAPNAAPNSGAGPHHRLQARLVIGADGSESSVRTMLGIGAGRHDHKQSAVLGTLATDSAHDGIAYERFTDSGPLALLPRPGRVVNFVECVSSADGERLGALGEAAYLRHLEERFGRRLGRFIALGPRVVVPLCRIEAHRQTGPRSLLIGNAARLLHPVAGQGFNLALRDVAALVSLLRRARESGSADGAFDPGAAALLNRFVEVRRADQRHTVRLTEALARTFRGHASLPGHLRAAGLLALDLAGPARRAFAHDAMGLRN